MLLLFFNFKKNKIMAKSAQLTRSLKKSLESFDVTSAIKSSNDETNTRILLIHPFLEILGYKQIVDFTHEYVADIKGKSKLYRN